MKKLIITLLIIVAIAGLCACNKKQSISFEKIADEISNMDSEKLKIRREFEKMWAEKELEMQIKCEAISQIGANGYAQIELVSKDEIAWSDWDYYEYKLTLNGKEYLVGVQRNETTVHLVDVY